MIGYKTSVLLILNYSYICIGYFIKMFEALFKLDIYKSICPRAGAFFLRDILTEVLSKAALSSQTIKPS